MTQNTFIVFSSKHRFKLILICDWTGDDWLKTIKLILFFFFSFISKIVSKTEKITQEITYLFLCPSISSLVGWYIEIPSIEKFTYGILVD